MANETAKYIKPICTVHSVQFPISAQNKSFSTGLSTMQGAEGSPSLLSPLRNEGVLTQVCMYDRAQYLKGFEMSVNNKGHFLHEHTIDQAEEDANTEKVLAISTQTSYQDLVTRADIWY